MKRSLAWLTGSLLVLTMGCPGPVAPEDMGGGGRDMASVDLADEVVDMAPSEPNRCRGNGCIGGPCNTSADCTEGKEGVPKICWKETLLNNPRYVPTPGGYCTQECQTHADCGTGYCFQMPGEPKKYCMALCRTATTCRKPGYACTFEAGAGMDGICFPDKNLDCQPTKGACDATVAGGGVVKGGCIRAAFEDKGICRVACQVGVKTCPPDTRFGTQNPPPQHCVFLDTTTDSAGRPSPTGDKWKGAVCLEFAPMPVMPGQRCTFWDECTDGYQCDRYAQRPEQQVCRQLCVQGNGVQDPTLYVPPGAMPATNMCANPNEGCSNALLAGAQNGQPGLCTPRN
ncbi:MAG: hypothetical protein RMK29_08915 [Myxococcales bacterium]|nr:hypothetical protein [Myxococcota bacterium]MDW8281818.1 hypothetical protein [Myxococcales bacterium]